MGRKRSRRRRFRGDSIEFSATAERQLAKLHKPDLLRVLRAIRNLSEEPYPRGTRKLQGYDDVYRIRVGSYRVLYSVESARVTIIVLKIGQRKDVYR